MILIKPQKSIRILLLCRFILGKLETLLQLKVKYANPDIPLFMSHKDS